MIAFLTLHLVYIICRQIYS